MLRGEVRANRGLYRTNHGENALEDFDLAIADLNRAIELKNDEAWYWAWRGHSRLRRASALENRQEVVEARREYQAAAHDYTEAIRLDPSKMEAEMGPWRNEALTKAARLSP